MARKWLVLVALLIVAAGVTAWGTGALSSPPPRPKNLIVISIDTLRAGHLGCYGYHRNTSPTIDGLARGGVLFEDASATSPWTKPSHASLFTGLYPSRHGAVDMQRPLSSEARHMAEWLGDRGFATSAVLNVSWLKMHGLDRGFQDVKFIQPQMHLAEPSPVADEAIRWFEQRDKEKPFFAFVHFFDVHGDYKSLPQFEEMFVKPYDGPADGTNGQMLDFMRRQIKFNKQDIQHLRNLYDGGIRQVDNELARVLAYLRKEGLLETSLVVLTSDHGEEFGEHGGLVHGYPFRPGDDLHANRLVVTPAEADNPMLKYLMSKNPDYLASRFWDDGQVCVGGREYTSMLASPCYKPGGSPHAISCISCHSLHKQDDDPQSLDEWADDQLQPGMRTGQACSQCHQEYAEPEKLTAHTHHVTGSSGSDCYNCHMPYTSYGLLKATRSHTITSPNVERSIAARRPNACNQCHLDETVEWTASHLQSWYDIQPPELDEDQRQVAAAVRWVLKGDARQRALTAWTMGWEPAREVSGTEWLTPYLAQLLVDDYRAVRYIAHRSMRQQNVAENAHFDFLAPHKQRRQLGQQIIRKWKRNAPEVGRSANAALLIDPRGQLDGETCRRLLLGRDKRNIALNE